MNQVSIMYHRDPAGWWADSPVVPGWSATAETLGELRPLAEAGVRFALEMDDVIVNHMLEDEITSATALVYDFVGGVMTVRSRPHNGQLVDAELHLGATA